MIKSPSLLSVSDAVDRFELRDPSTRFNWLHRWLFSSFVWHSKSNILWSNLISRFLRHLQMYVNLLIFSSPTVTPSLPLLHQPLLLPLLLLQPHRNDHRTAPTRMIPAHRTIRMVLVEDVVGEHIIVVDPVQNCMMTTTMTTKMMRTMEMRVMMRS